MPAPAKLVRPPPIHSTPTTLLRSTNFKPVFSHNVLAHKRPKKQSGSHERIFKAKSTTLRRFQLAAKNIVRSSISMRFSPSQPVKFVPRRHFEPDSPAPARNRPSRFGSQPRVAICGGAFQTPALVPCTIFLSTSNNQSS